MIQAIGRFIRSETDRGVVLLIDARFNETRYRRLFPTGWKYSRVPQPWDCINRLEMSALEPSIGLITGVLRIRNAPSVKCTNKLWKPWRLIVLVVEQRTHH